MILTSNPADLASLKMSLMSPANAFRSSSRRSTRSMMGIAGDPLQFLRSERWSQQMLCPVLHVPTYNSPFNRPICHLSLRLMRQW